MIPKFNKFRLEEICDIYDGPHATPKKTSFGPIFLGISSLQNGRLDLSNSEHLSQDDFLKWTRRITPKSGDLVFSYETRLGDAALIPEGISCCLGRRMGLMRAKPDKVDPAYLLYHYLSPKFQDLIRQRTIHGSTVDRIPLINMPKWEIELPNLQTQKEIASSLKAIDEKIELNIQLNLTLESFAQVIFKEWFIDFGPVKAKAEGKKPFGMDKEISDLFPESFEESRLGMIPKGWSVSTLDNLIDTVSETYKFEKNEKVIFLNTSDILKGEFLNNTFLEASTLPGQAKKKIKKGDILFSEIRPANGRYAFVNIECDKHVVSTKLMVLRSKAIDSIFLYFYLTRDEFVTEMQRLAESRSGTFPQITFDVLGKQQIILPDHGLLKKFVEILRPLYEKKFQQTEENKFLIQTRDLLLPKLISGEISLSDVSS